MCINDHYFGNSAKMIKKDAYVIVFELNIIRLHPILRQKMYLEN